MISWLIRSGHEGLKIMKKFIKPIAELNNEYIYYFNIHENIYRDENRQIAFH